MAHLWGIMMNTGMTIAIGGVAVKDTGISEFGMRRLAHSKELVDIAAR